MTETETFVLADHALNGVVQRIRDDQWDMPMPASFQRRDASSVPTLREIIGYHAYDDSWVPDMLAGRTMDEVGADAFKGDLLGERSQGQLCGDRRQGLRGRRTLDDFDRTVHCSFGDFTAREYLWQINSFRGLRAHDIARVIGVDPELSDELVQGLWDEISPHADEWRTYGVFPPAVPVPDDAPLLVRLLAITGRDPYA